MARVFATQVKKKTELPVIKGVAVATQLLDVFGRSFYLEK